MDENGRELRICELGEGFVARLKRQDMAGALKMLEQHRGVFHSEALFRAAKLGHIDMVNHLLAWEETDADANYKDGLAFKAAAGKRRVDIMRVLAPETDEEHRDRAFMEILGISCCDPKVQDVISAMVDNGWTTHDPAEHVMYATYQNGSYVVEALLRYPGEFTIEERFTMYRNVHSRRDHAMARVLLANPHTRFSDEELKSLGPAWRQLVDMVQAHVRYA